MDVSATVSDEVPDCRTDRYRISLTVYGQRQLLADKNVLETGDSRISLTQTGKAVVGVWQELPLHFSRITADTVQLMPDGLCGFILVKTQHGDNIPAQRLLYSAIRFFIAETTRLYNRTSTQDYSSRLWQSAVECCTISLAEWDMAKAKSAAQGTFKGL